MMNKNLLILSAGGHGRVVIEIAEAMGTFERIDFLDDHSELAIGSLADNEKLAGEYSYPFPTFRDSKFRMKWMEKLEENYFTKPVLIHPSASISPSVSVYPGSVVEARAVINTNTVIERGYKIN